MAERISIPIAVSIGDVAGIGPEIVFKAIRSFPDQQFAIIGPENIIRLAAHRFGGDRAQFSIVPSGSVADSHLFLGRISAEAGRASWSAASDAIRMAVEGRARAVVTAPISKAAWRLAGHSEPGHTELVERLTGRRTVMSFLGRVTGADREELRLALVTAHIPLGSVPEMITVDLILKTLEIVRAELQGRFAISDPEIAVTGLNPHAGESGDLGSEELDMISPAIAQASEKGWKVSGPVPADAAFTSRGRSRFDLLLAMYHDQGLAAFKALTSGSGVNFTMGAGIVRTSPDHGTAFEIAGEGSADPSSMVEAIEVAIALSRNIDKK